MTIDYSALLYDPVYAELGVEATLTVEGTAGEVVITVIDDTKPKTITSGSLDTRGVEPQAYARIPELIENGIAREDYRGSLLLFNGRAWEVRNYELRGSPNGEDVGEVRFFLKAADSSISSGLALGSAAGVGNALAVSSLLPDGVTLQDIDGGPTYYADNNFTYAAAAGWDDPSFMPVSLFLERIDDATDFATWIELGFNTMMGLQGNSPALLEMRDNPGLIWAIPQSLELTQILTTNDGVLEGETVGIIARDEPGSVADLYNPLENIANAIQDNRFWHANFLHTSIDFNDLEGVDIPDVIADMRVTPNATTRHIDLSSTDHYFCAGSHYASLRGEVSSKFHLGGIFGQPEITEAQCRRPCRYGDYVRFMREGNPNVPNGESWFTNIGSFPIGTFIETNGPYSVNDDEDFVIKPAEINAAVWSTIINRARFLLYFSLGESTIGDSLISGTFWQSPLPGESISNYDQIVATNAVVHQLATVINSPFAEDYVTVSPAAQYLNETQDDAGFDVMAKYHNVAGGDSKFYIFAMPRVAATASQNATFTIANSGATQVTVINEARTISVTGGTTFTDNFATGNTVHIYRVD